MFSNRDLRFIQMATEIAKNSPPFGSAKICAAVTLGNKLISVGTNKNKKHPKAILYARDFNSECCFLHAEISAIISASRTLNHSDWKKVTLYIARVKKPRRNGELTIGLSKPCSGCRRAIKSFGIRKVIYTTNHNTIERL